MEYDIVFEKPEDFKFDISKCVCFSGHRPKSLPGNGNTQNQALRRILSVLRLAIEESLQEGYTTFIIGMAQGVDIWAGRFLLEIRRLHPEIKIVCVVPFADQSRNYSVVERFDYNSLLEVADQVILMQEKYSDNCMRKRNEYMVNHSSKLIAVVKNYRSGTGMTINIARNKGIKTRIIDVSKDPEVFSD